MPDKKSLLSVAEAQARVLAPFAPTPAETVSLAAAAGRVTAAPITARLTHPPADVSAMDGYAVRAADTTPGTRLRLAGAAPAGHPWEGTLAPGEALRIFTGSPIPQGADAVLIQEEASREGESVVVEAPVGRGKWIRRAGHDFTTGATLIPAGRRLTPRDIGLLAAANHPWVAVHRRPRCVLIATGDEIVLPGEPLPPGSIVSSNAHALAALVEACGGEATILPIVGDTAPALIAAANSARGADLVVTTGGASVGEYDLVRTALARDSMGRNGLELDFWKIAMRPGKPLIFGRLGETPLLGLPGNPVSALVCGIVYLRPALRRLLGLPDDALPTTRATLGVAMPANDWRADFVRAAFLGHADPQGRPVVAPFPRQDSDMMRLLAAADALVLRPPEAPALDAGAEVDIIRLDTLGL